MGDRNLLAMLLIGSGTLAVLVWLYEGRAGVAGVFVGLGGLALWCLAVLRVEFFVFALVVTATNVFGLVDLRKPVMSDLTRADAIFAILCSGYAVVSIVKAREKGIRVGSVVGSGWILVLIAGQILLTSWRINQSLWMSVKCAKPVLFYAIGPIIAMRRQLPDDMRKAVRWLVIGGILASLPVIIGFVYPLEHVLPGVVIRGRRNALNVFAFYRTIVPAHPIIYFALLMVLFDGKLLRRGRRMTAIALLAGASLLLGYRAFWAGLLVGYLWVLMRHVGQGISRARAWRSLAVGIALAWIGIYGMGGADFVAERVVGVEEDLRPEGSWGTRVEQIRFYWPIIMEHPILGLGFAHPAGPLSWLAAKAPLRGIGTYDVGWVDMLIKFGLMGSIIFFLGLWRSLRWIRSFESVGLVRGIALGSSAFVMMYVIALVGAAPFTWKGGVIPLALLMGLFGTIYRAEVGAENGIACGEKEGRGQCGYEGVACGRREKVDW